MRKLDKVYFVPLLCPDTVCLRPSLHFSSRTCLSTSASLLDF